MKKLLILLAIFSGNVFSLSLGDTVNADTAKVATTTQSTMTLSSQDASHSEYTISKANSTSTVLVNNRGVAYGFKWSDKHPDIAGMLGSNSKYKTEYDAAYAARPKGDHRRLIINTTNLSVVQGGLPNSKFNGEMYAKDLQPAN